MLASFTPNATWESYRSLSNTTELAKKISIHTHYLTTGISKVWGCDIYIYICEGNSFMVYIYISAYVHCLRAKANLQQTFNLNNSILARQKIKVFNFLNIHAQRISHLYILKFSDSYFGEVFMRKLTHS